MKITVLTAISVAAALVVAVALPVRGEEATQAAYSPEALETLLAPVALYPDPVLAQVLATSVNPQEVLDAGNWLVAHADLTGKELEEAASAVGFTPPMLALIQFPTVVDMMCMKMDWTTELGTAFQADEPGVLAAVQRLRTQAAEMGNLTSSDQMKVTTEEQNNQQVIVVQPADPQVVYVPQYDPATVYTTAPAATTTTVVESDDDDEYSGGEMVTAGLLAFGAGILVNEVFDDDDDDYYSPNWGYGYGGPSYYPPPYYPRYGNGYRPANGYKRPAHYQHGFNNNNIYVNAGGDDYFNRFEGGRNNYKNNPRSPISAARTNRPELAELNRQAQTVRQPTTQGLAQSRKVQGSYAGAKPGSAIQRPAATSKLPKGTYAGATNPVARQKLTAQTAGVRDRGRAVDTATRPAALQQHVSRPSTASGSFRQAVSDRQGGFQRSGNSGRAEFAASQRGRASMGGQRPARSGRR